MGRVEQAARKGLIPAHAGSTARRTRKNRWRGLIPAHAGSTRQGLGRPYATPAHPRSRGEHIDHAIAAHIHDGSSPLTRGAPHRLYSIHAICRLIPAHAGSTSTLSMKCVGLRAHPRSRGEHRRGERRKGLRGGSSPLTRGAHRYRQGRRWHVRGEHDSSISRQMRRGWLIPAHAGSTRIIS